MIMYRSIGRPVEVLHGYEAVSVTTVLDYLTMKRVRVKSAIT